MASNRLKVQSVWIDAGLGLMNAATLFQPGQLGAFYAKDGNMYQLVQFKSTSTAIANGTPVMWTDRANFVVSAKVADSKRNEIAGVALGTITAGNYDFIQVRGNHATVLTNGDDDIAQGDVIIMGATDGVVDSTAAATAPILIPLGVASAADVDANNTVAVDLTVPLNGE